jgi:hypothetical protein
MPEWTSLLLPLRLLSLMALPGLDLKQQIHAYHAAVSGACCQRV